MATLSIKHIQQLLASPEPEFKHVGIQQLIAGLPDTSRVAIEYLTECQEDDVPLISENLRKYLPFLRSSFAPPKQPDSSLPLMLFDQVRVNMEVFFTSLQCVMKELNVSQQERFLKRLTEFPGIAGEVQKLVRKFWGAAPEHVFDALVKKTQKGFVKRQLMLFVSYTCNLECPYCFARKMKEPDMSLPQASRIFDWAQKNEVSTMTFCGGEPTIYPYFPVLLDELKERGLRSYFATNLLFGAGVLEKLQPSVVDALIVHVAHPDIYKGRQWTIFQENLKAVLQQGVSVAMRINIYARNHDWFHLFALAENFALKEVQLALTFPNSNANNRFVKVDEFTSLIPAVTQLMETFENAGLRVAFSKPLPLCLFPESMQYEMLLRREYSPACSVFMDGYTHNVCISPGGNVSPCLALLNIARPFSQFQNWDDLSSFCHSEILQLLVQPFLRQCSSCFLFHRRLCQGACLGHKKFDYPEHDRCP